MTGAGESNTAETAFKSVAWDYVETWATPEEIKLPLVWAIQYRQEPEDGDCSDWVLSPPSFSGMPG
jgi:hypothetical protein